MKRSIIAALMTMLDPRLVHVFNTPTAPRIHREQQAADREYRIAQAQAKRERRMARNLALLEQQQL